MQPAPRLSNREREVLQLLLEGKSNKLIAHDMKVSERTVEFHLTNIYSKFQVNSRMELVLRLKDDTSWLESENLGDSTVADKEILTDNDGELSSPNWLTSLRAAALNVGKELKMTVSASPNTENEINPNTFFGSIRTCLTNYAEFEGRAGRPEFWWFALFVVLCTSAFTLLSETLGSLFLLAVLLPLLAVGTRRLRDTGHSPWWQLFLLVPIGGLVIVGSLWVLPSLDTPSEENALPT